MRFVILHCHIFKNAGTTLADMLETSFSGRFARFDEADRNAQLSNARMLAFVQEHEELQAISSHQLRYPMPAAPEIVFFDLLFLRDPIDRIRSIYSFFRKGPVTEDPLCVLAHECGLRGFIERLMADHPHIVNDPQVNMLATDGAYRRPPGPDDLQRATETMLTASFLGVVDRFPESMVAGQYFWRPAFPGIDPVTTPANVSSDPGSTLESRLRDVERACGKTVFRDLKHLTALDTELVQRARREVERRFRLVPLHDQRLERLERTTLNLRESGFTDPRGTGQMRGPASAT